MQRGINIIVCVLVLCAIGSCSRSMGPADYVKYITDEENGLKKIIRIDGWEYTMQYRPHDFIMLTENKGSRKGYDRNKRRAELRGFAWFNISIKRADNAVTVLKYGIGSIEAYNKRLNYYLNEAAKDISLKYGKETLHPSAYLFENNYNLTPQETIVVGFSLPGNEDVPEHDMRLSIVDRVFDNGIINASFAVNKQNSIPILKY